MDFLYSLSLAFNDLKDPAIKKVSILNGVIWGIVWIILGILIFHPLSAFSIEIINFLPFKFLQHSGAYFILMILWMQAVLITIGVVVSVFSQIINNKYLSIALSVTASFLWLVIFYFNYDTIISYLENFLRIFPFESIEEALSGVISVFIIYSFYIASMYLSFLFFAASKIEKLKEIHYPEEEVKSKNRLTFFKLFIIMFRDLMIFMLSLFILFPVLFVPFVNILVIVFLWSLLIKESISEIINILFSKKIDNKKLWIFSVFSVFFNFIPIANFFAPAIGVLCVFHYVFEKDME